MTNVKGQIINAYEKFMSVLSEASVRQFIRVITVNIKRIITHQSQKVLPSRQQNTGVTFLCKLSFVSHRTL